MQITRDQFVGNPHPAAPSQVMFELGLALPEDARFMQHREPRMLRVENEEHESLVRLFGDTGRSGIWEEAGGYSVRFYATQPEQLPKSMYHFEGVLPVVLATSTREVRFGPDTFADLLELDSVGNENTGHDVVLSRLDTNAATLYSGEKPDPVGICRILQVDLLLRDGTYEPSWGSRPQGNERQVSFRTPIEEAEQVVVTLADAYEIHDVPFAAGEVLLP